MAIALVASATATAPSSATTAAINTTGATLLIVSISDYSASGAAVISDSKGNTYTYLTVRSATNARHQFVYCLTPTVGTGHTFTVTGSNYQAITAYAFSGVGGYQTESGTTGSSLASLASGSVTPSSNGALVITGVTGDSTVTDSIAGGYTANTLPFSSGNNMQGSAAYLIQATAAAINPTWTFSPNQSNAAVSTAVLLLPSISGETTQFFIIM